MDRHFGAIRTRHQRFHRFRIFGAEIENLADFDAARLHPPLLGHLALEPRGVVNVLGRGVDAGPLLDDRRQVAVVIDIRGRHRKVEHVVVAIHRRLAGIRQHDEFVAEIAADRTGLGAHRDRLQPHPCEGPQVSHEHLVVGAARARLVEIERIGILHQEFAAAHHAEARTLLIAELPLDVIEIERQALVRLHIAAEYLGDHFLVGRPVQQFALVAVGDAQHFGAVGIVAAALAPQVGQLQRRHQQFERAGAILFFAHDLLDLLQHAKAQRQPRIDARRLLPHHAGTQHQPMRNNLGLLRVFLQDRQKEPRQSHWGRSRIGWNSGCAQ